MESRLGKQSAKLTLEKIQDILNHGDLTRMPDARVWYANAHAEDERLPILILNHLDAPSLRILTEQPESPCVKQLLLNNFNYGQKHTYLKDNPLLIEVLRDVLLPLVGPDDETKLRFILMAAIQRREGVAIRVFYDALWSKAITNVSNDVEHLREFYSDIRHCDSNVSLVTLVIRTGISRHIHILRRLINDTFDEMDTYTQSKLIEWASHSNITMTEMPVLERLRYVIPLVKDMSNKRNFLTSKICAPERNLTIFDSSIVPRILSRMERCASSNRKNEMQKDVAWLISEICMAFEEKVNEKHRLYLLLNSELNFLCKPLLVGSAAECTQSLFIDEFDYIIWSSPSLVRTSNGLLYAVVSDMSTSRHHPRLVLDSMYIQGGSRFFCLHVQWMREGCQNTPISVDLIPSNPLKKRPPPSTQLSSCVPRANIRDWRDHYSRFATRSRP